VARLDIYAPLNARQRIIRDAVHRFHEKHNRIPSRRELATALGRKDGGYLFRVVEKLRRRGEMPRQLNRVQIR
jgi:hypothetical protein